MKQKMREIEKLYASARAGKATGKGKKRPSRGDQYKKKGPPLDKRMRKDKRGLQAAEKRNKAKGRGGKSPGGGGGKSKGGKGGGGRGKR
jgi:hypothetical protein